MTAELERYQRLEGVLYALKESVEGSDAFEQTVAALAGKGLGFDALRCAIQPAVAGDLHVHTNYSDGNLPPRKVVWLAKFMGLAAVGITDHDSVLGVPEAVAEGQRLSVAVVPGVEFGTGRPGCEILAYFPHAETFVAWLDTPAARPLLDRLDEVQRRVHQDTCRIIADVNAFLTGHGVGLADPVTEEELGEWFSGQKPYYPGTLAVLGLKRLPAKLRDELGIHDPREFNTQVVSPALKRIQAGDEPRAVEADSLAEVFAVVEGLREDGVRCLTALAHPRELETKGKMSRPEVEPFVQELVERYGLDGLEVNNSRDTAEHTAYWCAMADRIDAWAEARGAGAGHPLVRLSFSSDFHVLAPGAATGEITLGYGVLDERDGHQRGNLRSCTGFEELLYQVRQLAR